MIYKNARPLFYVGRAFFALKIRYYLLKLEVNNYRFIGVVLFKEELDAVKIIGIAVILVAVMLLGREKE